MSTHNLFFEQKLEKISYFFHLKSLVLQPLKIVAYCIGMFA